MKASTAFGRFWAKGTRLVVVDVPLVGLGRLARRVLRRRRGRQRTRGWCRGERRALATVRSINMFPGGFPRLFAGVLLVIAIACASARTSDQQFDASDVLLHVDYRSGGDTPIGFLLTFLADGQVWYLSPSWKTHWGKLNDRELSALRSLMGSREFWAGVEIMRSTGPAFACCDAEEIGIFLGSESPPFAVVFDELDRVPQPVLQLLSFLNRAGEHHFGRRYRRYALPIPEPEHGLVHELGHAKPQLK